MMKHLHRAYTSAAFGYAAVVAAIFLTVAFVIWLGWNLSMPPLLGLHQMSYPEALGFTFFISLIAAFRWAFSEEKGAR